MSGDFDMSARNVGLNMTQGMRVFFFSRVELDNQSVRTRLALGSVCVCSYFDGKHQET